MGEAGETGGDACCDILGRNMVVAIAGRRWTTLTWTTLDDVGHWTNLGGMVYEIEGD